MKKLIISLFGVTMIYSAFSQIDSSTPKFENYSIVENFYQNGHYKKALILADSVFNGSNFNGVEKQKWQLQRVKLNQVLGNLKEVQSQIDSIIADKYQVSESIYQACLVELANLYLSQEKVVLADSVLSLAVQQLSDSLKTTTHYVELLHTQGVKLLQESQYSSALTLFLQAKSLLKNQFNNQYPLLYLKNLKHILDTYLWLEDGENFEQFYKKAQDFQQKNKLERHIFWAECLELQGYYCYGKEDFLELVHSFKQALPIYRESFGEFHPLTNTLINNLAIGYQELGDAPNSAFYLLKALNTQKVISGENSLPYAEISTNLADLYVAIGQHEKAIEFAQNAITIFESQQATTNEFYGLALFKKGMVYLTQNTLDQAAPLLLKADSIFIENQHEKNILLTKNALGNLYRFKEKFEASKKYYLDGLELSKQYSKEKTQETIDLLTNLALTYHHLKEKRAALVTIQAAKKLCLEIFSPNNIKYAMVANKFGQISGGIPNKTMANKYFSIANKILVDHLKYYYPSLNEFDRAKFLTMMKKEIISPFYHYVTQNYKQNPRLIIEMQNLELAIKGLGMESSLLLLSQNKLIGHPQSEGKYNEWKTIREKLKNALVLPFSDQVKNGLHVDSLQKRIGVLEQQIGWLKDDLHLQLKHYETLDLQTNLDSEEATLDFVKFHFGAYQIRRADSVRYGVIITTTQQTHFVPLCREDELQRILNRNIKPNALNYLTSTQLNQQLYQLIWTPLAPYLKEKSKLHIVPEGLLHKVAFATLTNPETTQSLIDRFEFVYHNSLKGIAIPKKEVWESSEILLLGGADFNVDSTQTDLSKNEITNFQLALRALPDSLRGNVTFNYLKDTKEEVENIAKLCQANQWQVQLFTDHQAVEEKIKAHAGINAPTVLHLATHGFFLKYRPNDDITTKNLRENLLTTANPLLRTGLAFAKANYAWLEGKKLPNAEDGILTAFEIYDLDFSKTKLVVLSACETGKGDLIDNEGIFGLQRAFKIAGVEKMIVSLWKVPDQATSKLMQYFYQSLLQGESIQQAFQQAQQACASENEAPYNWGGFILIE